MSQEMFLRKIPEDMRPWECNVNGVKYVYPAGTEQNVPAEVAALIDTYWEKQKVDYPETGTSFNDLRDKPFGESTEVLFDQRVEFVELDGMMAWGGTFPETIETGKTYTVTYNGTDYNCVAYFDGDEIAFLGNLSAAGGDDTGEPFIISVNWEAINNVAPDAPSITIVDLNGDPSATVKIEKPVIHTIDPKFLPGGGGGMLVTVTLNDDDTYTPDKTFQEVIDAIATGVDVRFVILQEGNGSRKFPSLIYANIGGETGETQEIWLHSQWSYDQYFWTEHRGFIIHGGDE